MEKAKRLFRKLLKKVLSREFISYGVFGVLTTLVNILLFRLGMMAGITYSIANILAVLGAKLFAYVTNKLFVFRHHCANAKELIMEILRFVFARGFTGVVDILGMIFAVEILCADEMIAKYILQVIVILLNYILSKKIVFRSKKQAEASTVPPTDENEDTAPVPKRIEMKSGQKAERKEKRKALRPWKGLTFWCLLFALGFSVATPVFHIIDNDFMIYLPGSNRKMENADPSAIYYPTTFADEAEALAYGEAVARQVSEEGCVLLTNEQKTLPLPANSRVSLFSTSSVNPVLGGKGSGRVDSKISDTLKVALEKEGFEVNPHLWDFYDQIPDRKKRNDNTYLTITTHQYEEP